MLVSRRGLRVEGWVVKVVDGGGRGDRGGVRPWLIQVGVLASFM